MHGGFLNRNKTVEGLSRSRSAWFNKLADVFKKPNISEEDWENAEAILLQADVGFATTSALLDGVRKLLGKDRRSDSNVLSLLKQEMCSILDVKGKMISRTDSFSVPKVIIVVGVNGVGKTTSIAKLAAHYQNEGYKVLIGAADTFRAAAIEQIQIWGTRIGVDVIAHQHGSDPSAVAFDTVKAGIARNSDVVIIDTAGRIHTKMNLMEELKKLVRVASRLDPEAPHEILLVLDSTTGQNGLTQARSFVAAVPCSGIILTKLDGSAKGGIVLSVCRELNLPIQFIGIGEQIEDLIPFVSREFVEALFTPTNGDVAP
jgi:fused signal recognition particle receptor